MVFGKIVREEKQFFAPTLSSDGPVGAFVYLLFIYSHSFTLYSLLDNFFDRFKKCWRRWEIQEYLLV